MKRLETIESHLPEGNKGIKKMTILPKEGKPERSLVFLGGMNNRFEEYASYL